MRTNTLPTEMAYPESVLEAKQRPNVRVDTSDCQVGQCAL